MTDYLWLDLQLFAEEKSEEATPHRKREARKKGQVARSADLNAAIVLLGVILLLFWSREYYIAKLAGIVRLILGQRLTMELTEGQLINLFKETLFFFFSVMAPIFLAAMVAGLLVNLSQVGFLFAPYVLTPRLQNINPMEGFKRILSKKALVEMVKALLKVLVVGIVTLNLIGGGFEDLLYIVEMDVFQGFAVATNMIFKVALWAVGIFLAIAVLDFLFQRYEFRQRIKMTKQEVKEEFKQTEGDPQIKARLREKQRELARHRMMQSVPEATVVITNPTHLAIALRYDAETMEAPRVVAKGAGQIAERIVDIAREHEVPVVENKPVAHMLYQQVEIGGEIPVELYQAVAEILAMLYRMGGRP